MSAVHDKRLAVNRWIQNLPWGDRRRRLRRRLELGQIEWREQPFMLFPAGMVASAAHA